jgi:hypothetical protein
MIRRIANSFISYHEGFILLFLSLWLRMYFGHSLVSAEIFTEGVEVSPETVTPKPGEYVSKPERAPEGRLLIVASITEQVAYVYRNRICIARSSVSTGRSGHRTPDWRFYNLGKAGPSYL